MSFQAPLSKLNLFRPEEVRSWLLPLAEANRLSFELRAPDEALLLASGALGEAAERHEIVVRGELAGWLVVPRPHSPLLVEGLRRALTASAESRYALNDFSRSLATAWKESNFQFELSQLLQDTMEVDAAAQAVVQQLARVQRASAVSLFLLGEDGWRDAARTPGAPACPDVWSTVSAVLQQTEPLALCQGETWRVFVPLAGADGPVGVLVLDGDELLVHAANMRFLGSVGAQIAQTLRLRSLVHQQIEATELRRDLALGAEIQRGLLPQSPPCFPGVALAAVCRPARLVGGDGYDHEVHDHGLDLVVADVSGHGVAAGLLMSSFLSMLRTLQLGRVAPAEAATLANRHICREVGMSGQYVTALYARLEAGARRLTYAGMGHPTPLLLRDGQVQALPAGQGLPAGMAPEAVYTEVGVAVCPGDVLVFYTDGLVEARSPEGKAFGVAGVADVLKRMGMRAPEAILQALLAACDAFTGGQPLSDDQTLIVLTVQEDEATTP